MPIYLTQLVGQSVHQSNDSGQQPSLRLVTFLHAATFVCGFTLAFVALGAVASSLGSFLQAHMILICHIAGIVLILLGLYLMGILKLPFLYQQKRFEFHPERPSYPASLLIGITFAIAWSPCIGPILGSILTLAASTATLQKGVLLLLIYLLGSGIPFLLLGLGLESGQQRFEEAEATPWQNRDRDRCADGDRGSDGFFQHPPLSQQLLQIWSALITK